MTINILRAGRQGLLRSLRSLAMTTNVSVIARRNATYFDEAIPVFRGVK